MTISWVIIIFIQMKDSSAAPRCRIRCFEAEKVAGIRDRLAEEEAQIARFARVFEVLGNRTRLRILRALAREELCVCDMAQVLDLSIAGASHQLRALHDRGWLHMRNDGKMVYYRLSPDALRQVLQEGRIFLEEGVAS